MHYLYQLVKGWIYIFLVAAGLGTAVYLVQQKPLISHGFAAGDSADLSADETRTGADSAEPADSAESTETADSADSARHKVSPAAPSAANGLPLDPAPEEREAEDPDFSGADANRASETAEAAARMPTERQTVPGGNAAPAHPANVRDVPDLRAGQPAPTDNAGQNPGTLPATETQTPKGSSAAAATTPDPADSSAAEPEIDCFQQVLQAGLTHAAFSADATNRILRIPLQPGTAIPAPRNGHVVKTNQSPYTGHTVYIVEESGRYGFLLGGFDQPIGTQLENARIGQCAQLGNLPVNTDHETVPLYFQVLEIAPGETWWRGKPVDGLPFLKP